MSSKYAPAIVDIATVIAIIKDMGGNSIKFFPMRGLETIEEYRAVVQACVEADFILEPTGGIDLTNFQEIIQIAVDMGIKKIIPHIYSSIINSVTKTTNVDDIKKLMKMINEVLK
nr:KDGP aldolase [Spiroplasma sp. ChiS]